MMSGLLALLCTLIMVTQVMAGIWTSNNFLYKPSEGARGIQEKTKFDSGLNQVDTRLGNEKWVNDPAYGGNFQAAVTAIGSNPTVLHIPPGTWPIAADLTIPANITLKLPRGAILNIANGKTLTLNGGVDGGLYQVFSWAGTGKVILGPGCAKEVYPEWWGAKGDGVTDCTNAIAAATNAAQGKMPVWFVGNNYLVTDTLALTVWNYSWVGKRTERGNAFDTGYRATQITFTPTDSTKYLVSRFDTTVPYTAVIGPFEHRNLTFQLGDTNGFEFGREDVNLDGISDDQDVNTIQKHVEGVTFKHCSIFATNANRASVSGVITRSGRKMVALCKAFETVFEDVTLSGGDTQIRTWGCDRPMFSKVRSLFSHLPFDFNGSTGGYGVCPDMTGIQIEGWTFTPIRTYNTGITTTNLRIEQADFSPAGGRRYDLTASLGYTANVAVGGTSFTFSHSMTGILFPGLSIIELSDGTANNTTTCLVTSVSGTTVGIAAGTYIHWASPTANVTRIHGYGPLHQPVDDAANDAFYTNVNGGAAGGAPSFVYVPGRSAMHIANAGLQSGSDNPGPSLVIGNIVGEQNYLNQQMSFTNCSPLVIGPPEHPLVHVDNWRQNYGTGGYDAIFRSKSGDLFASFSQVQRVWTFCPKDSKNWFQMATTPVIKLAGEANTSQFLYAWLLKGSNNIWLQDKSLPTSGNVRIRIKAKAVTAGGILNFAALGNGAGATTSVALSTSAWTIYEVIIPCPASWQGSRDGTYGAPGFNVWPTVASIYLAAVTVEELPPGIGMPVLTAAPVSPYQGLMVIADRATWDPKGKGSGGPYPVWYNGSAWKLPSEQ